MGFISFQFPHAAAGSHGVWPRVLLIGVSPHCEIVLVTGVSPHRETVLVTGVSPHRETVLLTGVSPHRDTVLVRLAARVRLE